jgi:hypothetical protein
METTYTFITPETIEKVNLILKEDTPYIVKLITYYYIEIVNTLLVNLNTLFKEIINNPTNGIIFLIIVLLTFFILSYKEDIRYILNRTK